MLPNFSLVGLLTTSPTPLPSCVDYPSTYNSQMFPGFVGPSLSAWVLRCLEVVGFASCIRLTLGWVSEFYDKIDQGLCLDRSLWHKFDIELPYFHCLLHKVPRHLRPLQHLSQGLGSRDQYHVCLKIQPQFPHGHHSGASQFFNFRMSHLYFLQ